MKRWLVGLLLVVLAGVLLVIVINDNRDPIAVLEEFGAKIKRNEQGEVVRVSLADTKITDAGLVHLKGLTELQSLSMGGVGSQITDAGLVHLKGLSSLQTLDLRFTQITDQGIADLKKALPNCKISK